jgi:hypothetical protein
VFPTYKLTYLQKYLRSAPTVTLTSVSTTFCGRQSVTVELEENKRETEEVFEAKAEVEEVLTHQNQNPRDCIRRRQVTMTGICFSTDALFVDNY